MIVIIVKIIVHLLNHSISHTYRIKRLRLKIINEHTSTSFKLNKVVITLIYIHQNACLTRVFKKGYVPWCEGVISALRGKCKIFDWVKRTKQILIPFLSIIIQKMLELYSH